MGEQTMNNLKRKLSSNVPENYFQNKKALATSSDTLLSSPSSAFALIDQFVAEEQSKGGVSMNKQHLEHKWWQREHLVLQFLEIVAKLIVHKDDSDPLEYVMHDIEVLSIDILGLQENVPPNIYSTIVTSALQISKNQEEHPDDDKDGLVKVDPKPKKGIISAIIDFAVKIAVKILFPDLPEPPSELLEGAFGPVDETSPTSDLKVTGEIPANLNGMMVRNGPNPLLDPVGMYSWIDGDSMLHGIRFKDGKATYVARYLQTSRLKQAKFFGNFEFLQYGHLEGKFGVLMSCVQLLKAKLEVLDMSYGWLNADDGLVYHDGKLMVLQDIDKPYVVNVSQTGDLDTLGINDYNKRLTQYSFLPHPKKDPTTGELFMVGVSYTPPYATYNYVTKQGVMSDPVHLYTVSGPSYMHNLGLTKNYVIFMDLPYRYDPEYMAMNDDWVFMYDIKMKPRFGILPRYATSEEKIKWFEFDDSFFLFHMGNAWEEEDGTIVLISCAMKPNEPSPGGIVGYAGFPKKTKLFFNPLHVSNGRTRCNLKTANGEDVALTIPTIHKITFNMETGETSLKELFTTKCDNPKINPSYVGRKSRYLYTSEFTKDSKIASIVKTDLKWNIQQKFELGYKTFGSEVAFVSRHLNLPLSEDDGYLTTYVHNEETWVSFTYVIDAQKMELIAMIELPNRVPYGFHATFVTEDEIQAQKMIT